MTQGEVTLKNSPPFQGGVPAKGGGGGLHNQPKLKKLRKKLRSQLTPAEAALWNLLKQRQLVGRKFRRQHSIGNYIVDFYCPAERLVIELDGEVHNTTNRYELDQVRSLFLQDSDILVLRFENRVVFDNPDGLLAQIKKHFGWKDKLPR